MRSAPSALQGSIRLGRLRLPRLIPAHLDGTKPYGFLYGAAQTSYTAETLGAINFEISVDFIKKNLTKSSNRFIITLL
jgi:hypothetical protein